MPKANVTAGGDAGQVVETDDATLNNDQAQNLETQPDENEESDDADEALPKSQKELDDLMKKRLARQKAQLEKQHKADLKKVTDDKDKSEVELEKQKSGERLAKVADKSFLIAARDAGASPQVADKLLKLNRAEFDLDDDGEILNIDDLMTASKKDFPEFFKKSRGSGDGGAGGDGGKISDPVKDFNDKLKAGLGM